MKTKVGIFFGGNSAEYPVSLNSAFAILKSIDRSKYEIIMIGISPTGAFYLFEDDKQYIKDDTWIQYATPLSLNLDTKKQTHFFTNDKEITLDIAFPVLHGTNGEDGRIQGLFELLNIKYVGCDMASSALAMDKYRAKKILESFNIKSPESILIDKFDSLDFIKNEIKHMNAPLFIKPLKAGSSFGITKIDTHLELENALNQAFKYDDKVIIEEAISGFEVGCAIIGNESLTIGSVDEIELSSGFFNFEEKYSLKTSKIHLPARISQKLEEEIKETALNIYRILGCKGCARVDLFIDNKNQIIFNEVNTMPGFTANSRFPNMLKHIGLSFTDVITSIIEMGLDQ